jgi:hypothetical protein
VRSPAELFFDNVEVIGECHIWTGPTKSGHGVIRFNGIDFHAHRIAFQGSTGRLAKHKHVFQTCGNKLCVRLEHLVAGDRPDRDADILEG